MKGREVSNLNRWMGKPSFAPMGALLRTPHSRKQDILSTQEDHRVRFFEEYRKEAEDYDKEFMKKYDEDLNTTLIFVSPISQWLAVYVLTQ